MIRNLLASTAIAGLIATGAAHAQTTAPAPAPMAPAAGTEAPAMEQEQMGRASGHLASNIIGETVYNGIGDDAENIGEVNDIVLGTNDGVEMIVIGVGGFLGIGQKNVAVSWDDVSWGERDGEAYLVIEATKESLEAQEEFEVAAYDPSLGLPSDVDAENTVDSAAATMEEAGDDVADATQDMAADVEQEADEMAADDDMAADGDTAMTTTAPAGGMAADQTAQTTTDTTDTMPTAAIDRSTLTEVGADGLSADNLLGTTVYGANDENVGEIGDVILGEDGAVDSVIIDVGGFLGIGEKEVAVGMDNLQFMSDEDGDYYLYTQFTEEQLDAQPAYDEATWADQRDQQRMMMQ